MGRTALHYAAAYHEYQDNILYKQLIRAGASEDVIDLVSRVVRECNDCVCVCVCVCVRVCKRQREYCIYLATVEAIITLHSCIALDSLQR